MIKRYLNPTDNIQCILDGYPLEAHIELHLAAGNYDQKLLLKHNHLKIIGATDAKSVIRYGDYSYKLHTDGLLYNTFRTSTVMILGNHVHLENLTIENTSGSGLTIGQAIALTLYGNKTTILNCELKGHQDTLFIGPLPLDLTQRYDDFLPLEQRSTDQTFSYIKDTLITGDVDFIFGSGTALFDHCRIISKAKGYITAPSTYQTFTYGFIFIDSTFESQTTDPVFIARPWRSHGKTLLYNSTFIGHFDQNRYDAWDKSEFSFVEHPYVISHLSKPLKEEGIKRLNQYLIQHFNRFIQMI